MNTKPKKQFRPSRLIARFFLIPYSLIVAYPLFWTLSGSLKTNRTFFKNLYGFPTEFNIVNYVTAWGKAKVSLFFFNSVYMTLLSLLIMVLFASTTSYVLARYKFKLNALIKFIYITGLMIPGMAGIIPLYMQISAFGMLDSRTAVALLMGIGMMPVSCYLLINFYKTIPTEISEAGIIDGCSNTHLFGKVMLPLVTPGLIPVIIMQFIYAWNEVYFSFVLIQTREKMNLQVGLMTLQKQYNQRGDFVTQFAAIIIVMLPTLIVYILFQRKIISSVTIGSVKG